MASSILTVLLLLGGLFFGVVRKRDINNPEIKKPENH